MKQLLYVTQGAALVVMLFVLMATGPRALAQTEATDIAALGVQLWPDYDRPAMLVLLTGSLPPGTTLPATVTVPIAPDADINAVARFTADNQLLSDVEYTVNGDQLTMTLPDLRFQVEYYTPYSENGDERSFTFDWLSALNVMQLSAAVQQPLAAESITIVPAPVNVSADRGDGLQYHSLASQAVPAGQPYTISVVYTSPTGALSAPSLAAGGPPGAVSTTPVETDRFFDNFDPLWLIAIIGGLLLVGLAWYFGRQQALSNRTRKPAPKRAPKPQPPAQTSRPAAPPPSAPPAPAKPAPSSESPRFCHQCGASIVAGDKFCRNCGTPLKSAA